MGSLDITIWSKSAAAEDKYHIVIMNIKKFLNKLTKQKQMQIQNKRQLPEEVKEARE